MRDQTMWQDRVVDQQGQVIQAGTPQSARNFNNLEIDSTDAYIAVKELINYVKLQKLRLDAVNSNIVEEYQEITLTNSAKQPFNNSVRTIPLQKQRSNTKYIVQAEVLEGKGLPGDVTIYDKQTNGFKINFTGSATSVKVALVIKGGVESEDNRG